MDSTCNLASLAVEAISKALGVQNTADVLVVTTDAGMNNWVYIASISGKREKYVVRLYNNGGNLKQILYEHHILRLLSYKNLNFLVPKVHL